MSSVIWIEVTIFVLALILLFLSGLSEASLNRRQRVSIRELLDADPVNGTDERGVDQWRELRAGVDTASLFSVVVIGAIITHAALRILDLPWLVVVLVVAVVVMLLVGRLIPLVMVERLGLADSPAIQQIANIIATLMWPFMIVLHAGSGLLARRDGGAESMEESWADGQANGTSGDESDTSDSGEIQHDEEEMIFGVLSMEDAFVREIMVPRPDVVAVELDTPLDEVVRIVQEAGHSRIPVYEDSIDHVRGIVYAKDLLRFVSEDVESATLADVMRLAMYVPESKRVDDLLDELQGARVHMAIVVDEYGGTAGIVTIEDVIEEIVGEIQDEYDQEVPLFQFESDGAVTVDGRMNVDELAEILGVEMPDTESETVGGLVQRELGHIPEPGEMIAVGPVSIRVEKVERRRIKTVQVVYRDDPQPVDSSDPIRAN